MLRTLAKTAILFNLITLVSACVSAATAHLSSPQPTPWLARLGCFHRLSYMVLRCFQSRQSGDMACV